MCSLSLVSTSRGFTSCLVRFFSPYFARNPDEKVLRHACVRRWVCTRTNSHTQAALNLPNHRECWVEQQTAGCWTGSSTVTNPLSGVTLNSKPIRKQSQPVAADTLKCSACAPLSDAAFPTRCKASLKENIHSLPSECQVLAFSSVCLILYWSVDWTAIIGESKSHLPGGLVTNLVELSEPFWHHDRLISNLKKRVLMLVKVVAGYRHGPPARKLWYSELSYNGSFGWRNINNCTQRL